MFDLLLAFSLLLVSALIFIRKRSSVIFLLFFFQSFWGLKVFGFTLNEISLILTALYLLFATKYLQVPKIIYVVLVAYLLVLTMPLLWGHQYVLTLPTYEYAMAQQPIIRSFLVLTERVLTALMCLVPFAVSHHFKSSVFKLAATGFVAGITFQSCLGLYQVMAHLTNMPVWDYAMGEEQYIAGFIRLNAFAGEPRHFAVFTSISLAYLLCRKVLAASPLFSRRTDLLLMALQSVALLFTFSTTAIILVSLMLLLVIGGTLRNLFYKNQLITLLFLSSIAYFSSGMGNNEIIQSRIVERAALNYISTSEFSSYAALELWATQPELALIGVGPGLPAYFLKEMPSYTNSYRRNTNLRQEVLRDPNGLILIVLETGVLGVVVLLLLLVLILRLRLRESSRNPEFRSNKYFCVFVLITGIISQGPLLPVFSAGLGCLLADSRARRKLEVYVKDNNKLRL